VLNMQKIVGILDRNFATALNFVETARKTLSNTCA
jgi:hypothetical protein